MTSMVTSKAVRAAGVVCFFAGLFFLAEAYTMAFLGMYIDCFGDSGCTLHLYGEPTLLSALYGSFLALGALVTFHLGIRALRWPPRR
jgi:hypothetical protein